MLRTNLFGLVAVALLAWQQGYSFTGPTPEYPVSAIPEALKKEANVVVRKESTTFQILSAAKGILIEEKAVTILNVNGDRETHLVVPYDKLRKVKSVEASIYAADGKLIRKLKKSDLSDHSYTEGSLMTDNRYQYASLRHHTYPYTIAWKTEVEHSGMIAYPTWVPQNSEGISVEESTFIIETPKDLTFRYQPFMLPEPVVSKLTTGGEHYQWQVKNLPAVQWEPYGVYWETVPHLLTAPVQFEMEGYRGNMTDWQTLGRFFYQLNKGRNALPPAAIAKVKELTSHCTTPEEKVKAVYEYMQQTTRYVSIQLGIGGLQPFEASVVYEKGYGDCKALSNYTMALLGAGGVDAYYTIISAGPENRGRAREDFTKDYFNHIILAVPLERDTLWLECTSQTNPVGHLGSFTGNRKALLINETGGHLVNTRYYGPEENHRSSTTRVKVQKEGSVYQLKRSYSGILFDQPFARIDASPQQQKEWIYENAGLPDIHLSSYRLEKQKSSNAAVMELKAEGQLQEKGMWSGSRLFIPLYLGKLPLEVPKPLPKRKTAFVQEWGYSYTDTLVYQLPAGYTLEHLPEAQLFKSEFGTYELRTELKQGQLHCFSRLLLKDGRFEATKYAAWVEFLQQVRRASAAKAVLVQQ